MTIPEMIDTPFNKFLLLAGGISILIGLQGCDSADDAIPIQQVDSQSEQYLPLDKIQQSEQNQALPANTYYFGFDLRSSPQEDTAQYLPFLRYLEHATGYHFKLHFTPKHSTTEDELGQNKSQFASMGAMSYLKAQLRYHVISLVRGINHQGKALYQSVLVTKPDSPIRNIKDIKGQSLAFGNPSSTQGYLIPRIMLKKHGISLTDLYRYGFTGSHQNCAESVISGKYDVCGMQDQLGDRLAQQGFLKIIQRSSYYPASGIVANNFVSNEVIKKVKTALINFYPQGKDRQGLYHWDRTEMPRGFVAAKEHDYDELRQWAIKLGFLEFTQHKITKQ